MLQTTCSLDTETYVLDEVQEAVPRTKRALR